MNSQNEWGELDAFDKLLGKKLADGRMAANERLGNKPTKFASDNFHAMHLLGVLGEIHFCRKCGFNVDEKCNGPERADAILSSGKTVDVKTSSGRDKQLVVRLWKKHKPCDVYVLVLEHNGKFKIAGQITKEKLFQDHNIQDLGYGPCYVIPQDKLDPI